MSSVVGWSSVVERNLDRITIVIGVVWFAIASSASGWCSKQLRVHQGSR